MRSITVSREVSAPPKAIWDVLADFPNIADWNGGVRKSRATSDLTEGVGATRHCDLKPAGTLEETIAEWEPEKKMVVNIDSATKLPIRRGVATFELAGTDNQRTEVRVGYEYLPKWNLLGKIIGNSLDKQLAKGFTGFLEDLETAAKAQAE